MWYSGRSGVFGAIGYATSPDGLAWTKYPQPVLSHGPAGSADSFSAADPTVLKDGSTWKMWWPRRRLQQEADRVRDVDRRPDLGQGRQGDRPRGSGREREHRLRRFAPTVWKTANGYAMLLTGRKLVGQGVFQTKIMDTTSTDGVTERPSPALNPSGSNNNFDYSNLNSPELSRTRAHRRRTSSTTPGTRSTRTGTSIRGSDSRPRMTATRSTR